MQNRVSKKAPFLIAKALDLKPESAQLGLHPKEPTAAAPEICQALRAQRAPRPTFRPLPTSVVVSPRSGLAKKSQGASEDMRSGTQSRGP